MAAPVSDRAEFVSRQAYRPSYIAQFFAQSWPTVSWILVACPSPSKVPWHAGVTRRSHVTDDRNAMSFFIERSHDNAKDIFAGCCDFAPK